MEGDRRLTCSGNGFDCEAVKSFEPLRHQTIQHGLNETADCRRALVRTANDGSENQHALARLFVSATATCGDRSASAS